MDYRYRVSSTTLDIIDVGTESLVKRLDVNSNNQVTCVFENDQSPPWKKEREIEECVASTGRILKKVTLFDRSGQEQLAYDGAVFAILELSSSAQERSYTWLPVSR